MEAPKKMIQVQELLDELEALRQRVSELECHERAYRQTLGAFEERSDKSPLRMSSVDEAIFVIFDRKLEFVNDRFAELFGVSPDEACHSDFDFMSLVAPESRRVIQEQYRKGCCGDFMNNQFNYTGLSKDGRKIACEAFLLFIPYKWGVAIQGTLRSISMNQRIDEALSPQRSDTPVILNTFPTGVLYADQDRLFSQANEESGNFDPFPVAPIPRTEYPVNPGNGNGR
jgi:PAS domain S-box-containing protein